LWPDAGPASDEIGPDAAVHKRSIIQWCMKGLYFSAKSITVKPPVFIWAYFRIGPNAATSVATALTH